MTDVDIAITVPLDEVIRGTEESLWDLANTAWSLKAGVMQIISEPSYKVVGHNEEENTVTINVTGYIEV